MIPWILCCLSASIGLSNGKLTFSQPLVPTNIKFLLDINVVVQHFEKYQQDECFQVKNFNMLTILQVLPKIEVSIKKQSF
jgi:hypothetical protein